MNNALQHSPRESEIFVSLKVESLELKLIIADQGSGLDQRYVNSATSVIKSEKVAQLAQANHGLGLYLVNSIAEKCNASVHIATETDIGTRVTIVFPQFRKGSESREEPGELTVEPVYFAAQHEPVINITGPNADCPRCLLVESEPDVQFFLSKSLSEIFSVNCVFNCDAALKLLEKEKPDIIITEISVDNMDGFEFIKLLRQDRKRFNIPIIVVTTQDSITNRLTALELDVDAFLGKPVSSQLLLKTAQKLTEKQSQKKQIAEIKENVDFQQSRDAIFLAQLNGLIQENIANKDFHFEDYFENFALSKRQFFRRVNALTRCTPKQYLIEKRLELAKYLLGKGVLLAEVSEQCGFKNIDNLKKLYMAHFGHEII